jgi:hypothetical protein
LSLSCRSSIILPLPFSPHDSKRSLENVESQEYCEQHYASNTQGSEVLVTRKSGALSCLLVAFRTVGTEGYTEHQKCSANTCVLIKCHFYLCLSRCCFVFSILYSVGTLLHLVYRRHLMLSFLTHILSPHLAVLDTAWEPILNVKKSTIHVCGFMHHSIIHTEIAKKCNSLSKFIIPCLYEAQHVSGDTTPIIRSLKLH